MIKEEYVSLDTAKLLKEAGFPQDIRQTMFYNVQGTTWRMGDHYWTNGYAKPTQTVAMRWLREEKKIFLEISFDNGFYRPTYYVEIKILPEGGYIDDISYPMAHTSYEAAAEAGIQAACKYLIEKGGSQ